MTASPAEIARRALSDHLAARPPAELLAAFAASRDADAFAGLLHQFGPLVLGVCRRVLGSTPDADDAFQSVFVALARQAESFRDTAALPAWLHRVALRTSRKLLARRGRSQSLGDGAADPADPFADAAWKDVRRVLDEELDALPETLRGPVVLCWLDGLTQDEAASRLGISLTTLKRRLNDGRARLRARLLRRGIAPVMIAAAVLSPTAVRAALPPGLIASTSRTAVAVAPVMANLPRILAVVVLAASAAGGLAIVSANQPPRGVSQQPSVAPAAKIESNPATVPLPPGAAARYGSEQFRVPGYISSSALSPDGKLLAIGGNPVRVYEAATWKVVQQLPVRGEALTSKAQNLVFSPDGRFLVGSNTGYVYIWEVGSGKLLHRIDGESLWRWTQYCAFTPENVLVISDKQRTLFIDPATAREIRSLPVGRMIALAPDGRVLVRMTNYDTLKQDENANIVFVDAASGNELFSLEGFLEWNHRRTGPMFSRDGQTFAILPTGRNEVELWNIKRRAPVQSFRAASPLRPSWLGECDIGYTADGKSVFAREKSGDMLRWDIATSKELPQLRAGSSPPLGGLHALPDGKTLLTTSHQGWVRIWDAVSGEERPIPGRYWDAVSCLAPDGKFLAVGDRTGRIDLLDVASGNRVRTLRGEGQPVVSLVVSRDGGLVAAGERTEVLVEGRRRFPLSRLVVLRASDGKPIWTTETKAKTDGTDTPFPMPLGFVHAESADLLMANNSSSGTHVWNIGTGQEVLSFAAKTQNAALNPTGDRLATDHFGEVVFLDPSTGRESKRIVVDPEEKLKRTVIGGARLAWSSDGRTLAATTKRDEVSILDTATGRERSRFALYSEEELERFPGPSARDYTVWGLAVSPDGKRIGACALHGLIVGVWDAETGKRLARLDHEFQVRSIAFTPDGKSVITFGSTGLGYRWDIEKLSAKTK